MRYPPSLVERFHQPIKSGFSLPQATQANEVVNCLLGFASRYPLGTGLKRLLDHPFVAGIASEMHPPGMHQ